MGLLVRAPTLSTFVIVVVPWQFGMVVVVLVPCSPIATYGIRPSQMDCAGT